MVSKRVFRSIMAFSALATAMAAAGVFDQRWTTRGEHLGRKAPARMATQKIDEQDPEVTGAGQCRRNQDTNMMADYNNLYGRQGLPKTVYHP
ncbi:hypothetical protein V8F06_006180 [Rhypophila decipiens]